MDYLFICTVAAGFCVCMCLVMRDAVVNKREQEDEANRMRMWAGEEPANEEYFR